MAITVTQSPPDFTPAYNPIILICSSTNTAQPSFKYVFDIVVGSDTVRIKQSPRPEGYGMIDVHRVVESHVTSDIYYGNPTFSTSPNCQIAYTIKIYEEYGTPPTIHTGTAGAPLATYGPHYALNISNEFLDAPFVYTDYAITNTLPAKKFFTNSPRELDIELNQDARLQFLQLTSNKARIIEVKTYDAGGTLLNIYNGNSWNFNPFTVIASQQMCKMNCGTRQLASNSVSFGGVSYYTVQLLTSTLAASSELFRYNITTACSPFEKTRLHFLNKLGGFDSFNFINKSTKTTDIVRSTYRKLAGTFDGSVGTFAYDVSDRGTVQFNTTFSDRLLLNSGWVKNDEAVWLKELFTSPEVYIESIGTGYLPVTVLNTAYETKTTEKDRLFSINIELAHAIENNRQRF